MQVEDESTCRLSHQQSDQKIQKENERNENLQYFEADVISESVGLQNEENATNYAENHHKVILRQRILENEL